MNSKDFMHWFEKQVKTRWPKHQFEWIEMGDWHWRLGAFDIDTLTEAVRRHKVCECYPIPNLKKVYDYAVKIQAETTPEPQMPAKKTSAFPEPHTFIMCTGKDERGNGAVGAFWDIILWPFNRTWTAADYNRVATDQAQKRQAMYGGVWEVFTGTHHLEMLRRSNALCGIKPLDPSNRFMPTIRFA